METLLAYNKQSRDHPKGKISKKKKEPLSLLLKSRIEQKFGTVRKELLNACSGELGKQVEYFSKVWQVG